MMSSLRVLVDTSVVLRYYAQEDARHSEAVARLYWLRTQGYILCVAPQVLYEAWVVLTRPKAQNGLGKTADEAYALIRQIADDFTLLPDTEDLWRRWAEVCRQHAVLGRQAHDARFVAWMESHGISRLCTFNPDDFGRYPQVECVPK
jgi:predicted nucleic acid-binding protein